ncbi:rhodanese-like domain-containing protein [Acidocella sp.]|uniref:rhodanese-like domain-containing protein n=1 Tax=Acidocella sp. TaxID=50710 RepID=UPI00260D4995|nr:rhodanese-like domain-containing protein [Acidocella sp.]
MPRTPKTRLSTLLRLIPALPMAVAATQPLAAARAATPDQPSLDALAQMVARGDDMVSVDYLKARILAARGDFTLIDIRAPDEFAAGHIQGAVNLTVPELLSPDEVVKLRRLPQVILYGTDSSAAAQAAVLLRLSGVAAMALSGGVQAWASTLQAAPADQAAITRALNGCPETMPGAATSPAVPPLPAAPAQTTPAKPKTGPVQLNGMCG